MALLADGRITTLERLQGMDASVVEVARVERVDLERKLELAAEEIGLRLKKFLNEHGLAGRVSGFDGEVDFGRVVVTGGLETWHGLETLAMVYSDAYFNQLNDRYKRKWEHYRGRATEAGRLLMDTGIGGVSAGVKRAMVPVVVQSGSPGPEATYFVSLVWRNSAGVAGAPSDPVVFAATELIRVSPAEEIPAGWTFDVYVGTSDADMTKQNMDPVAGAYWDMPGGGLVIGATLPQGQMPEFYMRRERIWQRG